MYFIHLRLEFISLFRFRICIPYQFQRKRKPERDDYHFINNNDAHLPSFQSTAFGTPTAPQSEGEYVSPLPPTMPAIAVKSPLLKEATKIITLPAGYDLTNLVKYKNPNHWAIRPHVETGKHYQY